MSNSSLGLSPELLTFLRDHGVREHPTLAKLRKRTAAMPERNLQIAPEQGQLLGLLVALTSAQRVLELGCFTGYSSLAMALHLPDGGSILTCDINETWTAVAEEAWQEAGVSDRIELRLGPALDTLDQLAAEGATFDLAFLDADKPNYPSYYQRLLALLRPGGLLLVDNCFWDGRVVDPESSDESTVAIRTLMQTAAEDPRIIPALIPIADGLLLALKR